MGDSKEPLVIVQDLTDEIACRQKSESMKPYVGDRMIVRTEVALMLIRAQHWIQLRRPNVQLCLLYGYRHPDIQKSLFDKKWSELTSQFPDYSYDELYHLANLQIAAPEVAGHPTGGAVDVSLLMGDNVLPFGTNPTVFDEVIPPEKFQTFSALALPEERGNRLFLREAMMQQGFAPFNGEWWHFSYGDRDWAHFYNKPAAIYGAVSFDEVSELISDDI